MTFQQTQQTNGALHNPTLLVPFRELATQLYDLRKKLGLNQPEMGKLLNVSGPSISMWERGNPPHGPNLEMLRKFLDQNWSEVMGHGTPRQETITFDEPDAPKQFVLKRHGSPSLRFNGVELGTALVGKGSVTLYATIGGTYVWYADQELVEGGFAEEHVNWGTAKEFKLFAMGFSMSSTDDLLDFANECGLEIFEDIE